MLKSYLIDYKVTNPYTNLRRENWKFFVKSIQGTKNHKIAILSIHFNNFEHTKKLIQYLSTETNQNFDIVIIENSTKHGEALKLQNYYCTQQNNIALIKPIHNLGSAGGYALGMEYIINQQYEYFFVVEDDVMFLEQNIFSDMVKYVNKNTLTFIHNCKNTRQSSHPAEKGKSRRVQTAGYPTEFIKKTGIIDPRYFFRGEDLERGGRIEQGIQRFGYKIHITAHNYLHPYLKSVNGNYARFYFSIRNQLMSLEKNFIKNYAFFVTLFLYIWTAMAKALLYKDMIILKSCSSAIMDFVKHDYSFENNIRNIGFFLQGTNKKEREERIDASQLAQKTQNLYGNSKILLITGIDREKLLYSKNILNIFSRGILISSSSTVFIPLSLLAPKVICIKEFNLTDDTISIYEHQNNRSTRNIFLVIVSLVVSLGLIIIVDIVIIISIVFTRLYKKIC